MINDIKEFGYPVRHRKKVPFRPEVIVDPGIARMNIEIFRFEEELDRFILSFDDYLDLITEAFSTNIHISVRLEGNPLTRQDVKRLTRGMFEGETGSQNDFPNQEVLNHILAYISPDLTMPWTGRTIKAVHELLLRGEPNYRGGVFRTDHRAVYSTKGQELFIPAPFKHIGEETDSLLQWLNRFGTAYYPVITGSIFFHEFESIHPFEDGNGRCGRSLFHIYLQYNGLSNSKLCLIEQNIVKDPEKYYELLAHTDHSGDHTDLILHFTEAVYKSYKEAVEKYRKKDLLSAGLDEESTRALVKAKQFGNWFTLEYAKSWFDNNISEYRLRNRLNILVGLGALAVAGSTKNKRYRFADPLVELRERMAYRSAYEP